MPVVGTLSLKSMTCMQAACDAGVLSSEEVDAAVRGGRNVSALLEGRVEGLLQAPVEVIAFSDEEGVRCVTS